MRFSFLFPNYSKSSGHPSPFAVAVISVVRSKLELNFGGSEPPILEFASSIKTKQHTIPQPNLSRS